MSPPTIVYRYESVLADCERRNHHQWKRPSKTCWIRFAVNPAPATDPARKRLAGSGPDDSCIPASFRNYGSVLRALDKVTQNLDLDLDSYITGTFLGAIFATELGERDAKKTRTLKGVFCTFYYCTGFIKNWLKAFLLWLPVCGTQPLVALCLLLIKNAVTVCRDNSVFQLVPVSNSSYKEWALVLLSLAPNRIRAGYAQYGPGRLWKNRTEPDPALYQLWPDSGCPLAVTGRNQNASGSDPACLLGRWIFLLPCGSISGCWRTLSQ